MGIIMSGQGTQDTVSTSAAQGAATLPGQNDFTNNNPITFTFNLGKLSATAQMKEDPMFDAFESEDLTAFDFQANLTWYSCPGQGWHKLFRWQGDADLDNPSASQHTLTGHFEDKGQWDVRYFTDPDAWLDGTWDHVLAKNPVNHSAWKENRINILGSLGDEDKDPGT